VVFLNLRAPFLVIILGYQIIKRQSVRQMRRPWHSLKRGDIAAIVLAIAVVGFSLYTNFKYPNMHRATGFGPEWQCNAPGRGGSSFCIRKPPADPASQATTLN
jgi:hypothetical protein